MDDIYVRCVPLPGQIRGFTSVGADGYSIYINDLLCQSERAKVYRHELEHIRRNDFVDADVQEIEKRINQEPSR